MVDTQSVPPDVKALLDRLSAGAYTPADLVALRRALTVGGQDNTVQLGKYNVNIQEGRDIQIGDRIFEGADAEGIRKAVTASLPFISIYQAIQARPDNPDFTKGEILYVFDHIQEEVAKGERANPARLKQWLKALRDMEPEIFDATAYLLTNPANQFHSLIGDVVRQVQAEDKNGDPFTLFRILARRVLARRIEIISIGASAVGVTSLAGLVNTVVVLLIARWLQFNFDLVSQFVLVFGIQVTFGWLVGLATSLARVIAQPSRPKLPALVRVGMILGGFALANAFIAQGSTQVWFDLPPLLIGALTGSGFALANEWSLARIQRASRRILFSSGGLAFTAALASGVSIAMTKNLVIFTPQAKRWLYMGSVNPAIIPGFINPLAWPLPQAEYVLVSALEGFIVGLGLAGGIAVGAWLAEQLEAAKHA